MEIDDGRIGRMVGVHRVVRDGVDPLVGPGISVRPASRERLAPHDLQSCQSHLDPPIVCIRPLDIDGLGDSRTTVGSA